MCRICRPWRRRPCQYPHNALDDVVYISEIALHAPEVEHLDRRSGENCLGEERRRHVGPAPRSINREEAQPRRGQPVKMTVAVRQQFVCSLGRRINTHRMIDVLILGEWKEVIGAVDARARCVHEVRDIVVTATLENGAEGIDVVPQISGGV